jgi:hypothetical protein
MVAKPFAQEIQAATQYPNGWVYRIAGPFKPSEAIPPEAIIGAWKVDAQGAIVGDFVRNDKYDSLRWPPTAVHCHDPTR